MSKFYFGRLPVFALALVLSFNLISCTRGKNQISIRNAQGETEQISTANALRVNLSSEPPTLDWNKSSDTTSSHVENNLMDGLTGYEFPDGSPKLVLVLAEKLTPSQGGKRWTIDLRKGVLWSDGVELKAQHVVDSWKRLLDAKTASEYAYFLFAIAGSKDFNEGKLKDFAKVGVKTEGDYRVVVELEKPIAYFPHLLAHHVTYPIRMDVIEKHGDKWTEPGKMVTLGPFTLYSWEHDKQIAMRRYDKYFRGPVALEWIVGQMINEASTALNLFESGQLDMVDSIPATELPIYRDRPEHRQTALLSNFYYGINVTKPPMDNVLVRQAIAHAIDRQEIVKVLGGGQIPMTSWLPLGVLGYDEKIGLGFDAALAKDLLLKAGYGPGKKFPRIELQFNTNEDHQKVAENVQAQLKRNLGIDVDVKNEEWKVYLNTLKTNPSALFRFGWIGDYPDPETFMGVFLSYSENNRTRWKSAEYDRLVSQGSGITDDNKRRELYSRAQKLLVQDEAAIIPLYAGVRHFLVSKRVQNFPVNSMIRMEYRNTQIKQ